jgi:hypothetical protein
MKTLTTNSIIIIGMIMMTSNCEEKHIVPLCIKGIPVERVGNCYLVIQVLNAPIGRSYEHQLPYSSSGQTDQTYSNAISTSLTLNVNRGDTIYFKYKLVPYGTPSNCGVQNALFGPPDIPRVEILSYSKTKCQ